MHASSKYRAPASGAAHAYYHMPALRIESKGWYVFFCSSIIHDNNNVPSFKLGKYFTT